MASPEARKCECTTALQKHRSQNPGSEPSAGRMYYGATEQEDEEGRRTRRRRSRRRRSLSKKQNLTQGVRKNNKSLFWDMDIGFQTFGPGSREEISRRIRI